MWAGDGSVGTVVSQGLLVCWPGTSPATEEEEITHDRRVAADLDPS